VLSKVLKRQPNTDSHRVEKNNLFKHVIILYEIQSTVSV